MIGLACLCGGLALAAAGGALILAGAGMPAVVAMAAPAALTGSLMFAAAHRWQAALQPAEVQVLQIQVTELEAAASTLRHDLRGVLSPALMVADRLVNNPDPAVRRAGDAVVRSIDRATALLTAAKPSDQPKDDFNPA